MQGSMAPCVALAALLLGTCAWSAQGVRDGDDLHEMLALYGNTSADEEGSKCTKAQKDEFRKKFQIGAEFGKPCSKEDEWGHHLEYRHPESPKLIALYIYPKEDHNNAFGLCTDGGRFSAGFCHRIYSQTLHYSVFFQRVGSVEDATAVVRALPPEIKIKHLVLGGHGDPKSLAWGEDGGSGTPELAVEDDASDEFFDTVYPHLLRGATRSTVFLDACLNGKVIDDKNMIQHVAHRLAGVQVWASKISWDNDEFELGTAKDFSGKIISETTGVNRMRSEQFGEGPLRTWGFRANAFCDDKASKPEAASELQQCRKACEGKATCKAFVWYPDGNKAKKNKCYLSNGCKETSSSSKGAMTFEKPSGSI